MPHVIAQSSHHRPSASPILSTLAVGVGFAAVALLIAGTISRDHNTSALLAWGLLAGVACIGMTGIVVIGGMIDEAVNRCVNRTYTAVHSEVEGAVNTTAMKVGQAIAEGLADESLQVPVTRAGVRSIY